MSKNQTGGIEPSNAIVPKLPDYVKNPILLTMVSGNWSLPLCKMMESIIFQLQDRIREHLEKNDMGSLVTMDDVANPIAPVDSDDAGMIKFEIPLKTLGIPAQNYNELDEACDAIINMHTTIINKEGKRELMNVFHKVIVPTKEATVDGAEIQYKGGKRRAGTVEIQMHISAAREILSLRKGYSEHIFGVPQLCRSPRTPRLYTYLSAWVNKGGVDIKYDELREWLGTLEWNASRNKIIKDSYTKYSEFKRGVLVPAQKEMEKLAKRGDVDFYFEFEPIYPFGKTKCNPQAIRFTIIVTNNGRMNAEERMLNGLRAKMIRKWKITPEDWEDLSPMLRGYSQSTINMGLNYVTNQMKKATPESPHSYVIAIFKEWMSKQEHEYVEYEPVKEKPTPVVDEKWKLLAEHASSNSKNWWHTYGACCRSGGVEDGVLTVIVPSSFVAEQWNKFKDALLLKVKEIWGVESVAFRLEEAS